MSDNLDIASEREDLARSAALALRKPEGPAPKGQCLECGELVSAERRWCDATCRDYWAKYRQH